MMFVRFVPFIFVFLWSTGFIGAKYALPFIEPFFLLFIRMLCTLAVFLVLCQIFRSKWPATIIAAHQMAVGLLIHGCYLGGVFAAIKLGMPAGVTAFIVGTQPLLTAVVSHYGLGNKLGSREILGLLLGFVGLSVMLISTANAATTSFTVWGVLAAIIALLGISIGTIYQKQLAGGADFLTGSVWQYFSTLILMAVLAWSFEERVIIWHWQLVLALLWLVLVLSVLAVLLLMFMIREGESAKVASYFYLVPALSCLEAWWLFDENLPVAAIAAIGLTIIGVYLVVKRPIVNG